MRYISFFSLIFLYSCGVYQQNRLFKTDEEIIRNAQLATQNGNYVIESGDLLEVRVWVDDGKLLIAPPSTLDNENNNVNPNQNNQQQLQQQFQQQGQGNGGGVADRIFPVTYPSFLIQENGNASLPLVGSVKLSGFTLSQADSLLASKYEEKDYNDVFVKTIYSNKRVIVFNGTNSVIVPLIHERMTLLEVIARAGGFSNEVRAKNIKVLRGKLPKPDVIILKLGTIESMGETQSDMIAKPNDIIYIEPIRKTAIEVLRDISPVLSFVTSVVTLAIVLGR